MAVGKKTGGRTAGTPNRASAAKVEEIIASGIAPLDYLLAVMRSDAVDLRERIDAAKAAAPYVHPRLHSVEHGGKGGGPLKIEVEWKSSAS